MIDRWLDSLTPRIVRRWAIRVLLVTGPMPIALLAACALQIIPWRTERPLLLVMLYALALLTVATAVMVAVSATLHLTVAKAFSHGYRRALRDVQDDNMPAPQPRRGLTLVE